MGRPWLSVARLSVVLIAWGMWVAWPAWGWAAVIVAAAPWMGQWLIKRKTPRWTALDAALLLFLLSAGVGLWAGYDRSGVHAIFPAYPMGWAKLWGLLLAAPLYAALAALTMETARRWAVALLTGIGAAVALLFSMTHFGIAPPALARVAGWLIPNDNVIAGVIAPLLVLDVGMLLTPRGDGSAMWKSRLQYWGIATGLVMLAALPLTGSRGAWIALGAALGLATLWQGARRCGRAWLRIGVFTGGLTVGVLLGGWLVVRSGLWATVIHHPDIANRLWIFLRGLLLVRDYPFTGSGLGHFALVDSTYAQLIHVPTLPFSHALLLDVAVEQGVVGTLAMIAVWISALWQGLWALARAEKRLPLLGAGLLALIVIIVHGLGDDALYSSRWSAFLWMPVGVIVAAQRDASDVPVWQRRIERIGAAALAVGLAVALFALRQALVPAWYANLGALAQTRAELPWYNYQQFDNPTLDQIRQRGDFSVAEAYFNLALTFDTGQPTARTRLAQMALARGDYDAALLHAQAAWDAGHRDRVTRLLFSDALTANGKVAQAASVAWGLTWADGRLEGQAFYRYQQQSDWRRASYAKHVARLLSTD
ncbi:MAG TPA: O-antigen ligase family protein [Anaerolineae bacterium]|nr:O-antigen ligase family protein [Anaerolineae bacterium]HQI83617.1 O-antigen ligase family protein [Anaerolineae bacterium]